jgi:hypothetical protein
VAFPRKIFSVENSTKCEVGSLVGLFSQIEKSNNFLWTGSE